MGQQKVWRGPGCMCIPTLHPCKITGFKKGLINVHRHLGAAGTRQERAGERDKEKASSGGEGPGSPPCTSAFPQPSGEKAKLRSA